ncbi:MAG: hypothetical protein ACI828_001984, partial [Flavobacteriales bacterium]
LMREANESKLDRAKKQVKDIKGWYNHLTVYIIINILMQLFYSGAFGAEEFTLHVPYWARFTTPIFWGLSLAGHGIYVFRGRFIKGLFKSWEEKKIKKILEDEESDAVKWE